VGEAPGSGELVHSPEGEPADGPSHSGSTAEGVATSRQIRGSSVLLVGRVLALVISLATQIVLVRALTKTEFVLLW
jgi:hypothetical protein